MEEIVELIRDGFAPDNFAEVARNIPKNAAKGNKQLKWALALLVAGTISLIAWHYYRKHNENK